MTLTMGLFEQEDERLVVVSGTGAEAGLDAPEKLSFDCIMWVQDISGCRAFESE